MAISLLLADDSPTIAKILGMALQTEDYEIRSVLTADEALRELRANPPALFLVDLSLPGKDGFAFAELIRAEPKLSKTKVVFLSSAFEPVDDEAVKKSGADLVIAKPFDPGELRAALRQLRDAPPKFPSGAKVQGSLSGQTILPPESTKTSLTDTDLKLAREVIAGTSNPDELLSQGDGDLDANSILAGLTGAAATESAEAAIELSPTTFDPPGATASPTPETGTAPVELSLLAEENSSPTLDLTGEFTPSLKTVTQLEQRPEEPETPPPFVEPPSFLAPKGPPKTPPPPTKPGPALEMPTGLSPNAEALAAFFAAEIESKQTEGAHKPAPLPAATSNEVPEEFEASMASIEWDASASSPADLDAWSAGGQPAAATSAAPTSPPPGLDLPPKAPPAARGVSFDAPPSMPTPRSPISFDAPPAAPPSSRATPRPESPATMPRSAATAPSTTQQTDHSGPPSFLFDTGGSHFRFAEDYINRITRSFTGGTQEEVPQHHGPLFPQESHDAPSPAAPATGLGGAWNPVDAQRMEQIVREEVQMAVREIVEKVAWEVIPELAENVIKRELEKVMKQLEGNS